MQYKDNHIFENYETDVFENFEANEIDNNIQVSTFRPVYPVQNTTVKNANIDLQQFTKEYNAKKAELYDLRSYAQTILQYNRITACGCVTLPEKKYVSIGRNEQNKMRYGGLMACAQFALCPVCAGKIVSERQKEINSIGVQQVTEYCKKIEFTTFTIKHDKTERLHDLKSEIRLSWKKLREHRTFRQLSMLFIKSIEITYGANGWHPHIHMLFFHDFDESQMYFIRMKIFRLWRKIVFSISGAKLSFKGFCSEPGDISKLAEYIVKMTGKPLAPELVNTYGKTISKTKNYWQLLKDLQNTNENDNSYNSQYYNILEYADNVKGMRFFNVSKDLRSMANLIEKTDVEIVNSNSDVVENIAEVNIAPWRVLVVPKKKQIKLLTAAQYQGLTGVHKYISKLAFSHSKKKLYVDCNYVTKEIHLYNEFGIVEKEPTKKPKRKKDRRKEKNIFANFAKKRKKRKYQLSTLYKKTYEKANE